MPMRKDLSTTYADYFTKNPSYKQFGDQAARTVEVPGGPNTVEMLQTLRDAYTKSVISGEGDVDHVAERGGRPRSTRWPGAARRVTATVDHGTRRGRPRRSARPDARSRRRRPRSNPLGCLFSAPYLVFVAVVFAYPLGFAVYMSFHDYFFTAPGVSVDRPFVGLENYADGARPTRPCGSRSATSASSW